MGSEVSRPTSSLRNHPVRRSESNISEIPTDELEPLGGFWRKLQHSPDSSGRILISSYGHRARPTGGPASHRRVGRQVGDESTRDGGHDVLVTGERTPLASARPRHEARFTCWTSDRLISIRGI
ncbi:hypothetical protein BHE74_00026580 [Ensete ventricosum]|nr:hypothetical protein BHE74_00026580 [Ensete ventricosum]